MNTYFGLYGVLHSILLINLLSLICPGSSGVEQKTENLCVEGSNPSLDIFWSGSITVIHTVAAREMMVQIHSWPFT